MTTRILGLAALALALAAAPATAQDQVKLGILNDQSSLYSDLTGSGSVTAARFAVEDFGGEVLGKPIEIVTADHQNKPDIGSTISRRWIDEDGVTAIVDVPASSVAFAVQEVTRDTGIPFLISGAASSGLTGEACSPTTVHWTYDTYALAAGAARGVVQDGGKKWFFITQDNQFGHALEADISRFVEDAGGEVVGSIRHPLQTNDFSAFLLQAQAAGPDVVALANAGSDFTNALKQAAEFQLAQSGIRMVGTSVTINDIHALGPKTAQGLQFAAPFYWDMTDETRAFSERFQEVEGKMPNHIHAGVYGAVKHYLEAVQKAGTTDGPTVVAQMKAMPIEDFFTKDGSIRADGRVLREFYLMSVKTPEESTSDWDLVNILSTIAPEDAALPLSQSKCPLVSEKS
ncbi:ABC transporter substrate-binding protein [Acuticoccus sp. I52.16.1]|uniref:ABC transporter substrate-binding protein n=1 Tax=Acuticoccus sp. I52.16.1 TaxID=2928472 RepID=UPI001FD04BC6|nr:ABC transporter substrate-binding protein [Acuticoccus sp. I52.16.1]UOM32559.1 ABC transporter substrate-binding protein [Acuticoccus sp. I52.16.1]